MSSLYLIGAAAYFLFSALDQPKSSKTADQTSEKSSMKIRDRIDAVEALERSEAEAVNALKQATETAEAITKNRADADLALSHALDKIPPGSIGVAVVRDGGKVTIYQRDLSAPRGFSTIIPIVGDFEIDSGTEPAPATPA